MAGLVEQIQRDALDDGVSSSTLLRRVKLAAAKLQIHDISDWVDCELNGYIKKDVPIYRHIYGSIAAWNPYHGWIPVHGDYPRELEQFEAREAITSLEMLIRNPNENGIHVNFSTEIVQFLNQFSDVQFPRYALKIGRGHIVNIIHSVRNEVLEWAIKLDKLGIKGTEFSFSNEEVARAQQVTNNYSFHNSGSFAGNFGHANTTGDISQQGINIQQAADVVGQIKRYLPQLAEAGVDLPALEQRLNMVAEETQRREPNQGILRAALTDIRNLVSGAGGNLAAAGVVELLKQLLGP